MVLRIFLPSIRDISYKAGVEIQSCRPRDTEFCQTQRDPTLAQHLLPAFKSGISRCLALIGCVLLPLFTCRGVTFEELRREPNLTPERLLGYFRDFKFQLADKVQPPEIFLAARAGDCDDFASLAADILRERKYTTRLIAVFMDGQTHVICYVDEIKGYLDYNRRQELTAVQATTGDLEDVADKVAAFFRVPWRCVGEVSYHAGERRIGRIVFR